MLWVLANSLTYRTITQNMLGKYKKTTATTQHVRPDTTSIIDTKEKDKYCIIVLREDVENVLVLA